MDSPARARLLLVLAAALWSLSGPFAKLLGLPGPTLAFFRPLFATLCLLPLLRGRAVRFRPAMVPMALCFAAMNFTFLCAMTATTAANAIFLQYTAPLWMLVASVLWLKETPDRRSLVALAIGMVGVAIIVTGGPAEDRTGIVLALLAGLAFAGVGIFLRVLRGEDAVALTVTNHAAAALCLVPLYLFPGFREGFVFPSGFQWPALFLFGAIQMALPYVLFSRALRTVSAPEAGILLLLEPLLNTLLAWLVAGEVPHTATIAGGAFLLGGVCLRILPARRKAVL